MCADQAILQHQCRVDWYMQVRCSDLTASHMHSLLYFHTESMRAGLAGPARRSKGEGSLPCPPQTSRSIARIKVWQRSAEQSKRRKKKVRLRVYVASVLQYEDCGSHDRPIRTPYSILHRYLQSDTGDTLFSLSLRCLSPSLSHLQTQLPSVMHRTLRRACRHRHRVCGIQL